MERLNVIKKVINDDFRYKSPEVMRTLSKL